MEFEEFFSKLKKELKTINLEVTSSQAKKFYDYTNLLLDWNKKINLTSITEIEDIIVKHFADSLSICKFLEKNSSIIDVGTGAGFPGLPLAILREDLKITLIDSLNKRTLFLEEVKKKLELKNLNVIHSRAEDLGKNLEFREKYDIAVSRAVASLNILLEYLIPFVKENGKAICMKGPNIDEEIKNAESALKELDSKIDIIENIKINEMERNIIIINKESKTSNKYPRKAGTPSKKPL